MKKRAENSYGAQYKSFRTSLNMTLSDVSKKTGISTSFLSLFENGKTDISFSNMQKIMNALGLRIDHILDHSPQHGRVVKLCNAKKTSLKADGAEMFILINEASDKKMYVGYFIMEPGATVGPMQHGGEEFVHVLEGSIQMTLVNPENNNEEVYLLDKVDTMYYPSTLKHTGINRGKKRATILTANTPPTF